MTLRPLAIFGLLLAVASGTAALHLLGRVALPPTPPAATAPPVPAASADAGAEPAPPHHPAAEAGPSPAPAELAAIAPAAGVDDRSAPAPAADTLALAVPQPEAPTAADDETPQPPAEAVTRLVVMAQPGDTLARILAAAGVPRTDAQAILDSLGRVFDPRELKPGHEIHLSFHADGEPEGRARSLGRLQGVQLAAALDREILVRAGPEGGFVAEALTKPVSRLLARSGGEIAGGSLLAAGMAAGVPAGVMTEMIRLFSFDVDFQRDIQPGDRFDLLYERFHLADGRLVRGGDVLYAALTLSGKTMRLYRYKDSGGRLDYYNEQGHSVRKALLKTPIDGARLTSRFGMRDHPILGYSVMHRGVDFGAPVGTPIFAAGDGTIDDLGERNGYGRYIRIRHSGAYATAYAHMNAYARGLKKGMRVRQGQVIGYVGASGRVTGPHLHYEVIRDGRQVNPVSVKFPTGEKLAGAELARFQAVRAELDRSLPAAQMALQRPGRHEIGAGR
jgi:murein DD-endopeptidase MepM/ murein hydrolase activator NlpD